MSLHATSRAPDPHARADHSAPPGTAEVVWITAPGVRVDGEARAELEARFGTDPRLALLAPTGIDGSGRPLAAARRVRLHRADVAAVGRADSTRDVDTVSSRAVAVRRAALEEIGGLDPTLSGDLAVADLASRARDRGYRVGVDPSVRVRDAVGAGEPSLLERRAFLAKHGRAKHRVLFRARLPLEAARALGRSIVRRSARPIRDFVRNLAAPLPLLPAPPAATAGPALTAAILVRNGMPTIDRTLESLRGVADEILVLDTGSTDDTVARCERAGARVLHGTLAGDFAAARNRLIAEARGAWVLMVDADEYLSEPLRERVRGLVQGGRASGYRIRRRNYDGERPLRFGFYRHDRLLRLFRRSGAFFAGAVHEKARVPGPVARVDEPLEHRPRTSNFTLRSFRQKWLGYAAIEAAARPRRHRAVRLARGSLAAAAGFLLEYGLLLGFLDGARGARVAALRAAYRFAAHTAAGVPATSAASGPARAAREGPR